MMENNKNKLIYYGILFYYLYVNLYIIFSDILTVPIVILHWNSHLILAVKLLLIILFATVFFRTKKFPKIKLWHILVVIVLVTSITMFNIPHRFYMGPDSVYTSKERSVIMDYHYNYNVYNTILFIIIACLKYFRIQRNEKLNDL